MAIITLVVSLTVLICYALFVLSGYMAVTGRRLARMILACVAIAVVGSFVSIGAML